MSFHDMPDWVNKPRLIDVREDIQKVPIEFQNINMVDLTHETIDKLIDYSISSRGVFNLNLVACEESLYVVNSLFRCQRCGRCCFENKNTLEKILLEPQEIPRIAAYLGWSNNELKYKCFIDKGYYHLSVPCPFYDSNHRECLIYPVRPFVCQFFPLQSPLYLRYGFEELDDLPYMMIYPDCAGAKKVIHDVLMAQSYLAEHIEEYPELIKDLEEMQRQVLSRVPKYEAGGDE